MASDASGSGNHGTVAGAGATWTASGKYGSALSFDGSSGNVTVPNAPSLSFNSSYTLEAWVRPTALSGYQTMLIKETTGGCAYWLQTSGTTVSSGFENGGCRDHQSTTPAVPVNQWSHLAAVFNDSANTYTLYLNGDGHIDAERDRRPGRQLAGAGVRPIRLRWLRLRALARTPGRNPHLQPAPEHRRGPGGHEHRDLASADPGAEGPRRPLGGRRGPSCA